MNVRLYGVQVQAKFEAAIQTDDIKTRIQERLLQERARLERGVESKIAAERKLQLLRKRKEQEQRLKEQVGCCGMLATYLACSLQCLMFHILLLPPSWGVILVLALYPPQNHQTCWILSTYTCLESIPLQLCGGINHSFIHFGFLPHLEAQTESCWDVATPQQILFWTEHD
jgi:hypothetical protein